MIKFIEKGVNTLINFAMGFCFTQFMETMNWALLFWLIVFFFIDVLRLRFIKEGPETEE